MDADLDACEVLPPNSLIARPPAPVPLRLQCPVPACIARFGGADAEGMSIIVGAVTDDPYSGTLLQIIGRGGSRAFGSRQENHPNGRYRMRQFSPI